MDSSLDENIVLQQAVTEIRAGQAVEGRKLLAQLVKINPKNVQAWIVPNVTNVKPQ